MILRFIKRLFGRMTEARHVSTQATTSNIIPLFKPKPIAGCYHTVPVFRENERRAIERRKAQEKLEQ